MERNRRPLYLGNTAILQSISSYVVLFLGTITLLVSVWLAWQQNLDLPWTSIRLAPAFALVRGYPLYSTPDTPPWVMVAYGPLYPLMYLPSTLAADPSPAVGIATVLAQLYVLVPAGLLFALCARAFSLQWSLSLVFFALLIYAVPSLKYAGTTVHADAPGFGFLLLACYFVFRGQDSRRLVLAGLCAGASAACKMNLLPAALALFVWAGYVHGWQQGVRLFAAAILTFCAIYFCVALRDGFAAVLLNFQVPAQMPWATFGDSENLRLSGTSYALTDKLRSFVSILGSYVRDYGPVTLALLLLLPLVRNDAAPAATMMKFFLLLAAVMLVASIVSIGKSGGDINSRALVTLPLTLAAVVALNALAKGARWWLGHTAVLAAAFVVALAVGIELRKFATRKMPVLLEAYTMIASEPGRWYFPFDPLAHLLVENKFRPNIDVVHCYAAAGRPVDAGVFRSLMPEDLRQIAVPPPIASWGMRELQRILPEYSRTSRERDLPQHQVIFRH